MWASKWLSLWILPSQGKNVFICNLTSKEESTHLSLDFLSRVHRWIIKHSLLTIMHLYTFEYAYQIYTYTQTHSNDGFAACEILLAALIAAWQNCASFVLAAGNHCCVKSEQQALYSRVLQLGLKNIYDTHIIPSSLYLASLLFLHCILAFAILPSSFASQAFSESHTALDLIQICTLSFWLTWSGFTASFSFPD